MFCNFFESPVNIANGRDATYDPFPIYLHHILEYTMCGGVGRSDIEGHQLVLRIVILLNGHIG